MKRGAMSECSAGSGAHRGTDIQSVSQQLYATQPIGSDHMWHW